MTLPDPDFRCAFEQATPFDASGNAVTMAPTNSPAVSVDGTLSVPVMAFDGGTSSQSVKADNNASWFPDGTDFTFCMLLNAASMGSLDVAFTIGGTHPNGLCRVNFRNSPNRLEARVWNGGSTDLVVSGVSTSQWYFCCLRWDESTTTAEWYVRAIDGGTGAFSPDASANVGTTLNTATAWDMYWGKHGTADAQWFDGSVARFALWKQKLTEAQILEAFNSGAGPEFFDYDTFSNVDYSYGQQAARTAFRSSLDSAKTSTQQWAAFGDSKWTSPGGNGGVFVPRLNLDLVSNFALRGTTSQTKWMPIINATQYSQWLGQTRANNTTDDTTLDADEAPPGFERGKRPTNVLASDGGASVLDYDGSELQSDVQATVQTYIDNSQTLLHDVLALAVPGSNNIDHRFIPTDEPKGDYFGTSQLTEDLTGLADTQQFKVLTSSDLDVPFPEGTNRYPHATMLDADDNAGSAPILLASRWRLKTDAGGIAVTTFSEGGYTMDNLLDSHGNAGDYLAAMGTWHMVILTYDSNVMYSGNKSIAYYQRKMEDAISTIRTWLSDSTLLIGITTGTPRINGTAVQNYHHDRIAGAAKIIADNDANVIVFNMRRSVEDAGFTRANGGTYLSDDVHPNGLGARTASAGVIEAMGSVDRYDGYMALGEWFSGHALTPAENLAKWNSNSGITACDNLSIKITDDDNSDAVVIEEEHPATSGTRPDDLEFQNDFPSTAQNGGNTQRSFTITATGNRAITVITDNPTSPFSWSTNPDSQTVSPLDGGQAAVLEMDDGTVGVFDGNVDTQYRNVVNFSNAALTEAQETAATFIHTGTVTATGTVDLEVRDADTGLIVASGGTIDLSPIPRHLPVTKDLLVFARGGAVTMDDTSQGGATDISGTGYSIATDIADGASLGQDVETDMQVSLTADDSANTFTGTLNLNSDADTNPYVINFTASVNSAGDSKRITRMHQRLRWPR